MFVEKIFSNFALLVLLLYCMIYHIGAAGSIGEFVEGNKCVAVRMQALLKSAVPYSNQTICDIEKKFLNCISTSKSASSLNIIQRVLSCTRLRLMKAYQFCELGDYDCNVPQELSKLSDDKKFNFPEIKRINFGKVHLEGCLSLFTYMQRYSIHPCTETAISALCMKPLIRGLGLFESNQKYFSFHQEEFTCNCAEIAQYLCADPKLCPTDIFNRDWKSFVEKEEKIKLLNLDKYGKCVSSKREKSLQIDKCVEMDFKAVGRCLQNRYLSYARVSFDDEKIPLERHCQIEIDLNNCLGEKSKSEIDKNCVNKNDFITWVRIQSHITMKMLEISNTCTNLKPNLFVDTKYSEQTQVLQQASQLLGNKLATPCGKQAIETCYYVRSYMHKFLVHPCIEWMMFYRCIRDNLIVCNETITSAFITSFLEGHMPISINKGNLWNHNECALLDEMTNYKKKDDIITMNQINPFKKNIDV